MTAAWQNPGAVSHSGPVARCVPSGPWIKAFTWLPRFTDDTGLVWLCPVWRRLVHKHQDHYEPGGLVECWFQYCRYKPPGEP
jgi:hypothetical protein